MKQAYAGDWFQRHRLITIGVFLLILWFSLVYMLIREGDAIKENPCEICAKHLGKQVSCSIPGEGQSLAQVIVFGGEYLNGTRGYTNRS